MALHDPKPLARLLQLEGLALGVLGLWWASLPASERVARLVDVAVAEDIATLPPLGLLAQPGWLAAHRWPQLIGMAGLVGLVAMIGLVEGAVHRQQDPQGGFRLTRWTTGVVGLGVAFAFLGLYLVLPWALPVRWVAGGLCVLAGLTCYALGSGRPHVS